jgi:hypothetical protein
MWVVQCCAFEGLQTAAVDHSRLLEEHVGGLCQLSIVTTAAHNRSRQRGTQCSTVLKGVLVIVHAFERVAAVGQV